MPIKGRRRQLIFRRVTAPIASSSLTSEMSDTDRSSSMKPHFRFRESGNLKSKFGLLATTENRCRPILHESISHWHDEPCSSGSGFLSLRRAQAFEYPTPETEKEQELCSF